MTSYRFVISSASRIANRQQERTVNGNRIVSLDNFFVGGTTSTSEYTDDAATMMGYANAEVNQLRYEGANLLADKLAQWITTTISQYAIGTDLSKLGYGKSLEVNMSVPGMETLVVYRVERMATDHSA